MKSTVEIATFAGGCFWCMVSPFDQRPGVIKVVSGYTGGTEENPTYEQVITGKTGHYEAVQITFDSTQLSYDELLTIYWQQVDPTDEGGQFSDRGSSYQTAIFHHNEQQRQKAEQSKQHLENSRKFMVPIVTKILQAGPFYVAEEEHQDFYKKSNFQYKLYVKGSGRERFLNEHWPKDRTYLKKLLTPIQYHVTQENGKEPPFENQYWNHREEGIYVDVVSGEPLFVSKDKCDSKTGWPTFRKPVMSASVNVTAVINEEGGQEVRSREGNNHLGYVYNATSQSKDIQYHIYSASLRFIHKSRLEEEGYGDFILLFPV
ncbi:peptide methionine sulfoxide reductase msrA/msrB [Bacillus iocasae]|uniref:Peptide methionine sulfoxide reductase MsrA n=1 Tax=Priestia iocasae TaxID=2291674 RepID=A0ABS2QRN2_9BACI|nr:peptide-methionine (S)-S-oxide reductase MsrA [Metabacillus iocasae]MBM7702065.1 peptide methionine sulfoxide reductase msrA/msrB [Metabacillus iocasae]